MIILGLIGKISGNPDPETMKFALGVAGGIIGMLLTVIGFLFKQKQRDKEKGRTEERAAITKKINNLAKQQSDSTDKLSSVVETVSETVNNLKIIVEVIKEQQEERDPRTERRLNSHSKEIQELGVRVAKIETHCRINHSDHVKY